jgi:hypothetical protein
MGVHSDCQLVPHHPHVCKGKLNFDPVPSPGPKVNEGEDPVVDLDDPVGLDRELLPRLEELIGELLDPGVTSIHVVKIWKGAGEMELDLWSETCQIGFVLTPVRRLVKAADDLDVLGGHSPASIPQGRSVLDGDPDGYRIEVIEKPKG